ncbi:MAG: YigZ family protein, partial [Schwartzia sp.]|nr:YigZ family protein [Schwartzia sp. (in: firmicutes)]
MSMQGNEPLTILTEGTAEFTVQRSRFIACIAAVHDEEEARAFVARLRKEHYDARHCCSAWILGADGAKQKSSDDGEPGGTAGMPILETMKRRGLTDAAVVVVRYFGGIKLGAGGLVRAYSHAAAIGIDAATLARRVTLRRLSVTVGYETLSAVEHWALQKKIRVGEAA